MPELLTLQDLANGHLDVKALGEAANGDENTIVTTRTGNTYPSAERAINIMFQNGGLPAEPFETFAKMETDGVSLPDGQLAMVYNETANNGLYEKKAGVWVKSQYEPLMLTEANSNAKYKTQDITVTDLNNLTEEGQHSKSAAGVSSILNIPLEAAWGTIYVEVIASGVLLLQTLTDSDMNIFSRRRVSDTDTSWGEWLEVTTRTKYLPAHKNLDLIIRDGNFLTATFSDITGKPAEVTAAFALEVRSVTGTVSYQRLTSHLDEVYVRRTANAGVTWSEWLKQADVNSVKDNLESYTEGSIKSLLMPSDVDLDTFLENGEYIGTTHVLATVANKPSILTAAGKVQVISYKVSSYTVSYQKVTNHENKTVSRRTPDSGVTWSAWKPDGMDSTNIPEGIDLDNFTVEGNYVGSTAQMLSVLNKPSFVTHAGMVRVIWGGGTAYQSITNHEDRTATRRYNGSTWTAWKEVVTESNVDRFITANLPEPVENGAVANVSYRKSQGETLSQYQAPKISDLNHFISYGQSLAVGAAGQPAISTEQFANNLTFTGAPRAHGGLYLPLVPLFEDDRQAPDGGSNRGETICAGTANYASKLMLEENNILPSEHVIVATSAGQGGRRISELNKGVTWYDVRFLEHARQVKNYAVANELSYSIPVISWAQGEFDQNKSDITQKQYYDLLIQLQKDAQNDLQKITGQTARIPFATYQTSYWVKSKNHVALAQLDVVKNNPNFYFTTPMYHLPHADDDLHLNNIGYKIFGGYMGRVYKQLVIDQIHPEWLEPMSATKAGNTIRVKFKVPTLPLVLDNTNLALTQDYGFKVVDSSNVNVPISTITVEEDTIVIDLGNLAEDNYKVRYALDYVGTGITVGNIATGNLRDSTPDVIEFGGEVYNLWHVAPHFELDVLSLQV